MKMKLLILATAVLSLLPLAFAQAAEFKAESESQGSLTINAPAKDLYLAGGTLTVEAPIKGDLVVAGGSILLNSDIEDSLFVAGGTITVRSNVGRHVRIGGGTITISGRIGGDLLIGGGTVAITKEAVIDGDLLVSSGDVSFNGTVKGKTNISAGNINLNGQLSSVKTISNHGLTIGSAAVINGDLNYRAVTEAKIESGAKITGQTNFTKLEQPTRANLRKVFGFFSLLQLLGTILTLMLVTRFLPKFSQQAVQQARSFWASLGIGFAALILTPIATIILISILIGIPVALILIPLYLASLAIGLLMGKLALGVMIRQLFDKNKELKIGYGEAIIGAVAFTILVNIPVINLIVFPLILLVGLGAVLRAVQPYFKG